MNLFQIYISKSRNVIDFLNRKFKINYMKQFFIKLIGITFLSIFSHDSLSTVDSDQLFECEKSMFKFWLKFNFSHCIKNSIRRYDWDQANQTVQRITMKTKSSQKYTNFFYFIEIQVKQWLKFPYFTEKPKRISRTFVWIKKEGISLSQFREAIQAKKIIC